LRDGLGFFGCCDSTFVDVEAAPNGDVWTLLDPQDNSQWVVARFDGEVWTTYTPPFASTPSWAVSPGAVSVGPDGLVWFAVNGLVSFDGTDWTYHIQGQAEDGTPEVSAVDVAPDGTVWYIDEAGVHILGNQ